MVGGYIEDVVLHDEEWVALSASRDKFAVKWTVDPDIGLVEIVSHFRHERSVAAVAFVPGTLHDVVSAAKRKEISLWNSQTNPGTRIGRAISDEHVGCIAVARDGTFIVSGGTDGVIRRYAMPT
jgi:WD40 repeat protein